jgi:hypothetical protein
MAYCPNCSANLDLQPSVNECWNCHANFGESSLFHPVSEPPGQFRPFRKRSVSAVVPHEEFSERWNKRWCWILILSFPAAVLLQIFVPVLLALAKAPSVGLMCIYGSRAIPCSFPELVSHWIDVAFVANTFLVGLPTLVAYVASVVFLLASVVCCSGLYKLARFFLPGQFQA